MRDLVRARIGGGFRIVPHCMCGHSAQIHAPDRLDRTPIRGEGPCTATRCWCDGYIHKENK